MTAHSEPHRLEHVSDYSLELVPIESLIEKISDTLRGFGFDLLRRRCVGWSNVGGGVCISRNTGTADHRLALRIRWSCAN